MAHSCTLVQARVLNSQPHKEQNFLIRYHQLTNRLEVAKVLTCIEVARLLFLRMNERNLISWNALLSGYEGDGQPAASITIYRRMEQACIRLDQYTLAGL
jgi:pentatricopeptide repeat protein